jgi:hypothetical protein
VARENKELLEAEQLERRIKLDLEMIMESAIATESKIIRDFRPER